MHDTHYFDDSVSASDVDLGAQAFWLGTRSAREGAFRALRTLDHLTLTTDTSFFAEGLEEPVRYWSLVRYADVRAASRNPSQFISGNGTNIVDDPPELADLFGSIVNLDDPRHFRLRSIVSRAFTPAHLSDVRRGVDRRAAALVDRVADQYSDGEVLDFVEQIASPLPLGVICDMMGIPVADEPAVLRWSNSILGAGDPEYGTDGDALIADTTALFDYAQALADDLRASPGHDLTSAIMAAEVDGQRLTSAEFGAFFILLVAAGNETTRNALSHGLVALTEHPDQRRLWFGDFDNHTKTAVEEIVRWATPVMHFRRTATDDITINNTTISAGDRVVFWYNSANRDETVWADPYAFDLRRPTQPTHVSFGGGGPHFCLGANLARDEIACVYNHIRRRMPELQMVDTPDYLQSNFINGIKRLPAAIRREN